jgi:hypothetical protein
MIILNLDYFPICQWILTLSIINSKVERSEQERKSGERYINKEN